MQPKVALILVSFLLSNFDTIPFDNLLFLVKLVALPTNDTFGLSACFTMVFKNKNHHTERFWQIQLKSYDIAH